MPSIVRPMREVARPMPRCCSFWLLQDPILGVLVKLSVAAQSSREVSGSHSAGEVPESDITTSASSEDVPDAGLGQV